MKKTITKLVCLIAMATGISFNAKADNEKAIAFSELPTLAQQTINDNFADKKVALVKMEQDFINKSYEVIFTDACTIEFNGEGMWTDIDCEMMAVPTSLVPAAILTKVADLFPDATVNEIERKKKGYEVKLSNRAKLKFDTNLNLYELKNKNSY